MSERPIDEIEAAYAFLGTIPPDGHQGGAIPWWHGHAIHEAYWAGLDAKAEQVEKETELHRFELRQAEDVGNLLQDQADLVPDLLAACEVARARLIELTRAYKETRGEPWTQDFDDGIQACDAAIAKARPTDSPPQPAAE